jgi:hypothetical protein
VPEQDRAIRHTDDTGRGDELGFAQDQRAALAPGARSPASRATRMTTITEMMLGPMTATNTMISNNAGMAMMVSVKRISPWST